MTDEIHELDCVALICGLPAEGLSKGQTGTVVLTHNGGEAFEVEFPLKPRESVVVTISRENLLKLKGLDYFIAAG